MSSPFVRAFQKAALRLGMVVPSAAARAGVKSGTPQRSSFRMKLHTISSFSPSERGDRLRPLLAGGCNEEADVLPSGVAEDGEPSKVIFRVVRDEMMLAQFDRWLRSAFRVFC